MSASGSSGSFAERPSVSSVAGSTRPVFNAASRRRRPSCSRGSMRTSGSFVPGPERTRPTSGDEAAPGPERRRPTLSDIGAAVRLTPDTTDGSSAVAEVIAREASGAGAAGTDGREITTTMTMTAARAPTATNQPNRHVRGCGSAMIRVRTRARNSGDGSMAHYRPLGSLAGTGWQMVYWAVHAGLEPQSDPHRA